MTGAVEHPSVLNSDAHIPSGLLQLVQSLAMRFTPLGAVRKEHVCALRLKNLHPVETTGDIIAGVVHIFGDNLPQFVRPHIALGLVGPNQRVHGEDVHVVVVTQRGLFCHPLLDFLVVDNVVCANQPRQIEGFGGRVKCSRMITGVLRNGLNRDVFVFAEDDVRPDFIGDDIHLVLLEQLHGPLQLPRLPDPSAGVVGRTENRGVDVLFRNLPLHIRKVHAPYAVAVPHQRRVNHVVAIVGQALGKADIGGRVNQHTVPFGTKNVQRGEYPAQNSVFIGDIPPGQTGHPVACLVPADDGVIVLLPRLEIAEMRLLHPVDYGLLNLGQNRKVHIGYPHRDNIEPLLRGLGRHIRHTAQRIDGECIFIPAV